MLESLREKYPELNIRKQPKYSRDRYAYTVELLHIGAVISKSLRWRRSPKLYQNTRGNLNTTTTLTGVLEGLDPKVHVPLELIRQIYQKIQEPLENKQISCRFSHTCSIRIYVKTQAEVQDLIDLILMLQTQYQTTTVLGEILAVPAQLEIGELAVSRGLSEYQYKVVLRDFRLVEHANFLGMLKTYESDLRLAGTLDRARDRVHRREKMFGYEWCSKPVFYSKDSQILTFLQLAAPGLIRKIFRLKHPQ